MGRTKELRTNRLIWTLIILLGALTFFAYIILYNERIVIKKTEATGSISKLSNIQQNGGKFELTQKELDELSSLYFASSKSSGDLTVQGVKVEMLNNELLIKVPIRYKNINLLLSSQGKLSFSEGEISYIANNYKIGKLPLPRNLVISQIKKLNNKNLYVENNLIKINPSVFPFEINNFAIINDKIFASATKLDINMLFKNIDKSNVEDVDKQLAIVDQKIQSSTILMNETEKQNIKLIQSNIQGVKGKSIEEKRKAISAAIDNIEKTIGKTSDIEKKKELELIKAEVEKVKKDAEEKATKAQQQTDIKRIALTKVKSGLSGAYSQVGSQKEQQIISIMLSTVNKMVADPSYDSSSNQASVKSIYSTLDVDSRNRVKSALFSSVAGDSLNDLRQAFGL